MSTQSAQFPALPLLLSIRIVCSADVPIWNSSFEILGPGGKPAGWRVGVWSETDAKTGLSISLESQERRDGRSCLRLSARDASSAAQVHCQQRLPAQPNTRYEVSYWAKLSVTGAGRAQNTSYLVQRDARGKPVPTGPTFSIAGGTAEQWRKLSFVWKTRSDARSLEPIFRLRVEGSTAEAHLWVDAVRVRPLGPAPDAERPQGPIVESELILGPPAPGTDAYERVYGPPRLGNVIANYSFEILPAHLGEALRKAYKALRPEQPIEWVAEGAGEWAAVSPGREDDRCLRVTRAAEGFAVRTRSLIAVDETKPYRARAWVKGNGSAQLAIVWQRVHYDLKARVVRYDTLGKSCSNVVSGTGEWQRIEAVGTPPRTAQFAYLSLPCATGRDSRLFVDDVVLEGLGDQEFEFLYSQAGFDLRGHKDVVVRAKRRHPVSGELRVCAASSGAVVTRKPLRYLGAYTWGRHYYSATFGELATPGRYYVEVGLGDKALARTPPFPIRQGRYEELLRLGTGWFYYQRSNYAVPGWHEAGFLDDATCYTRDRKTVLGHHDLTGGWHDAADLNKWTGMEGLYTWVLARTARLIGRGVQGSSEEVLDEAAWGIKYLLNAAKAYPQTGCFARWVKRGKNVPGTGAKAHGRWCNESVFSPEAVAALATYAGIARDRAPERAAQCSAVARESYPIYDAFYEHYPLSDSFCMVTLAGIELWQATADNDYLDSARIRLTSIAETILRTDLSNTRFAAKASRQKVEDSSFLCVLPIEGLLLLRPDDEVATICRQALERFCKHLAHLSQGPLGHTHYWDQQAGRAAYYASPARHCPYVMLCAAHLAMGASLLERDEWRVIAEKNLQYAWGRNFAGVSNMATVGHKWNSQYTELQAVPSHHDGIMPGSVFKGHGIGRGTFWSTHNVRIACMPTGFPHAILPNPYFTMHQTANNEVWGFANTTFILATSEVVRVAKPFKAPLDH